MFLKFMQLNAFFINFFIRWDIGNWSDCSVSCGRGMQTRPVVCAQRVSSTSRIDVQPSKCPSPRPESSRTCMNKPCAEWKVGEWQKVCLYTNTCIKGILHSLIFYYRELTPRNLSMGILFQGSGLVTIFCLS